MIKIARQEDNKFWTALLGFATALFSVLVASRLYGRQAIVLF